jgi:hypothetical protein
MPEAEAEDRHPVLLMERQEVRVVAEQAAKGLIPPIVIPAQLEVLA